jgi:hypothetical protein
VRAALFASQRLKVAGGRNCPAYPGKSHILLLSRVHLAIFNLSLLLYMPPIIGQRSTKPTATKSCASAKSATLHPPSQSERAWRPCSTLQPLGVHVLLADSRSSARRQRTVGKGLRRSNDAATPTARESPLICRTLWGKNRLHS